MEGKAVHRCLHVLDLEKSLAFYKQALGMEEIRRMGPDDGSFGMVFIGNPTAGFQVELTWNKGRTEPYDNGGKDSHLAFAVPDIDAARALHEEMGCVCFVNHDLGVYFIEDPDGCWLEIIPYNPDFAEQAGTDVIAAMRSRKSIRTYSDEPIPDAILDAVIEAGLLSESGRNIKPWELIVIRNHETLQTLSQCRDNGAGMLAGANAAVAVIADPSLSDTWIEDCSIVMANMHLEAAAKGVGSCWIQGRDRTAQDGRSTTDFVRDTLGFPESFQLEAILSLGMPVNGPSMEQRSAPQGKVHRERF